MLKIARPSTEPKWIEIAEGARVLCAPASLSLVSLAKLDAKQAVFQGLTGDAFDALPLKEKAHLNWRYAAEMAKSLARQAIMEWEGVCDEDGHSIPVNADTIAMVMEDDRFFSAFDALYATPAWFPQIEEKKSLSPSVDGTSAPEADKPTAEIARVRAKRARISKRVRRRRAVRPGL